MCFPCLLGLVVSGLLLGSGLLVVFEALLWRIQEAGGSQSHVGTPCGIQQQQHVEQTIHPWSHVLEQPTPEIADGRFAKVFPLKFPMGVANLRQSRLQSDYSFIDAV